MRHHYRRRRDDWLGSGSGCLVEVGPRQAGQCHPSCSDRRRDRARWRSGGHLLGFVDLMGVGEGRRSGTAPERATSPASRPAGLRTSRCATRALTAWSDGWSAANTRSFTSHKNTNESTQPATPTESPARRMPPPRRATPTSLQQGSDRRGNGRGSSASQRWQGDRN